MREQARVHVHAPENLLGECGGRYVWTYFKKKKMYALRLA